MKLNIVTVIVSLLLIKSLTAQWQPDVRLTNNPAPSYIGPRGIAVNILPATDVHVVWADFRDGNYEVYYKRSTDKGVSWGIDSRLTNDSAQSGAPTVSVLDSVVHIMWGDNSNGTSNSVIYYKRSTDAGVTWGVKTRLSNNLIWDAFSPTVGLSGGVVHLAWTDRRDNVEIYYKRSTDKGVSWGIDTRLTNDSAWSEYPSISVSGMNVHLVWSDQRDGINGEIYYKRSTDGGTSWSPDMRLTTNIAKSLYTSVSVSDQIVHVIWQDERDGPIEIYYKRSTDNGETWGPDTRLTNGLFVKEFPSSSVSGHVVHLVWEDNRQNNKEIYYKQSTDDGTTWGADVRLTNNSEISTYPSVASSGSAVHVVWYDGRDWNPPNPPEIYYKRNPTGALTGFETIDREIPQQFVLEQNYPNPFNPSTGIKYAIDSRQFVQLKVYDVLGNEIATLVNEEKPAGSYEVNFDASRLSSGVYFYKLQAGSYTETKKMVITK